MKETKHTPGPWSTARRPVGISLWEARVMAKGLFIADAYTQHYGPGQEETEANARLIKESPALLAVAEAAYHELRIRCGYKPGDAVYDDLAKVILAATGDKMGDRP